MGPRSRGILEVVIGAFFLAAGTFLAMSIGRGARHMEEAAQSVLVLWVSSGVAGFIALYALIRGGRTGRILGIVLMIASAVVGVFGVSWISPL